MPSKKTADPLLIDIQQEIMPRRFVRYDDMFHFTRHLHQIPVNT